MAPVNAQPPFQNAILAGLSAASVHRLSLQAVDFDAGFPIYEANAIFDAVYFPEAGLLSIVSTFENGKAIEVGTIGREGVSSSQLLLGAKSSPYRCFVQVAGSGFSANAQRFAETVEQDPSFRLSVLQYENSFRIQTMQGMACNGLHSIEQRCCRWLLMTHDRVGTDDLKLSHEFLAMMLGVRRASVTEVLSPLQDSELVRSVRGIITILNRKGLEQKVCECYWTIKNCEINN